MRLLTLRTVLVATDLTPASDEALDTARRLVEASGARLHVAHVVAPAAPGTNPSRAPDADTVIRQAGMTPGKQQVEILDGDPAEAISALADRIGADLIVLGHHRHDAARAPGAPVGSTAYAVITRSAVPCLVVTRGMNLPLRRALVATDFSEAARGALLVALSWTSALRARAALRGHREPGLVALHVDSGDNDCADVQHEHELLNEELESLKRASGDWAGVQVRGLARAGTDPARCIAEFAREDGVDLVVMGTRALTAASRAELGSISDAVVRELDIPVLLVPPAVWRNYAQDLDAA